MLFGITYESEIIAYEITSTKTDEKFGLAGCDGYFPLIRKEECF